MIILIIQLLSTKSLDTFLPSLSVYYMFIYYISAIVGIQKCFILHFKIIKQRSLKKEYKYNRFVATDSLFINN